jgi:hypothetical protein
MTTMKSISRHLLFGLGAVLLGLPATAALASDPSTVSEAQTKAAHYEELAAHYRAEGGAAYKAGIVQSAEAKAAKYNARAEELQRQETAPAVPVTVTPIPTCPETVQAGQARVCTLR